MPLDHIVVRGAREHNLKNIDVRIPRDKLVVITGLSGSGKSSLAFDTIYAEGQRRYVESLSAYARQFLGLMEKPDVDHIDGLSPAISIDQKSTSNNPRSTVGTVTEIYDYMRLLWARAGRPHCPVCGRPIERQTVQQIVDATLAYPPGSRLLLLAPVARAKKGEHAGIFDEARRAGFVRVRVDGQVYDIEEVPALDKKKRHDIDVVVDRLVVPEPGSDPAAASRIADSVEQALKVGQGVMIVATAGGAPAGAPEPPAERIFSEHFACPYDGTSIGEIEPRTFSFNSPHGACPRCTGLGVEMQIDPALVIPDRTKSIAEGAVEPWSKSPSIAGWYLRQLEAVAEDQGFTIHTPISDLTDAQLHALLYGTGDRLLRLRFTNQYGRTQVYDTRYEGVIPNLQRRYKETDSDYVRQDIEKYMAAIPCPECRGRRLRPEALAVLIDGRPIADVSAMSIAEARAWFDRLAGPETPLSQREQAIAVQVLKEIRSRLEFLVDVGLDYLTLDRVSGTLSGGESQRIRLATQIGSALMGVLYICDEPSIGLHPVDGDRLIRTLERLRDLGNTVLVVEHDEAMMRAADWIIDMGPGAGIHGGRVVAEGPLPAILGHPESITGAYLSGRRQIPVPRKRRPGNGKALRIVGARENNLRNLTVEIPLGKFVAVTGVSGSGKSSLITDILVPRALQVLHGARQRPGAHDAIEGLEYIDKVVDIDQSPIGRTPRSNPATYTGAFTLIRDLFASVPEARARGYKAGRFSFNVKGGRCEECAGDGYKVVEMQFLPDVTVPCEACHGKRYNREALEITFRGKNIAEVLDMTVSEAVEFFERFPRIKRIFDTLEATGLGYIKIGQPATTLSGGEAQRIKLASELSRRSTGRTLYVLDEPTTGLSFQDVAHLLDVLHRLVDAGNTVVVIEHHLDVIKSADHIIDLGPLGGDRGGQLIAAGTPEEVARCEASFTGRYLRPLLEAAGTLSQPAGAAPAGTIRPVPGANGRSGADAVARRAAAAAARIDARAAREAAPPPQPAPAPKTRGRARPETASERELRSQCAARETG
ncbi:excinuclease ABC subunit UvrA [Tepidiforma flava]|uniref:UvrABC system protein A n=1 Tax=Tepidiforma flava TaxID=3004094 RepID=A0ABY7M911_9CHLR|nr:excinuclease ABC subunit UvrA [Tepidiforma flava]WBL36529.1 excinuclease ABC subunit UvrA [Tepidiforma flava]